MSNPSPPIRKKSPKNSAINLQAFLDIGRIHPSKQTSLDPPDLSQAHPPRFKDGEILRWRGSDSDTDWGVALGRFYSYAPHSGNWDWCYLLWLDPNSKSAAWCPFDTAWEEDLEKYEAAEDFATTRVSADSTVQSLPDGDESQPIL